MLKLHKYKFVIIAIALLLLGCQDRGEAYKIGVSQYSTTPRDSEVVNQIIYFASLNGGYDIEFATADRSINKQIQQIELFISAGVDAMVVSSDYPDKLCGVIDEALERGIGVVMLDRISPSSRFSAYIKNKNSHIGVILSRRYKSLFDDADGNIIELMDGANIEQSNAIHKAVVNNWGGPLSIIPAAVSDDATRVYAVVDSLLALYPKTNMIFAHTNAIGLAAKERCRGLNIDICGFGDNTESAVNVVIDGGLNGYVLYTPTGTNAMRAVQKIVRGERVEREQSVFAQMVDQYNVKAIRRQYRQDRKLKDQLQLLNGEVTDQKRLTLVHELLLIVVVVAAITIIFVIVKISRRKTQLLQSKMRELLNQQSDVAKPQEKEIVKGISSQDQRFIVRLGQIIEENLSDPEFDVEQMSEKLNYSNIQAYRKIKALTGETPSVLLRNARVKRGDYLLRNSDKTIADISIEVGFSTPANFSKYYKATYGELPSKIVR